MVAIYARQSVERVDSISIQSQIERCMKETDGAEYRVYTDCGYSGKNTQRPGFQRMMADMREGLLSKVVVYKLDRISRSILDFSSMMEVFGSYHVEFVSTTEKFDTSSPMGRAMLNICVVFAQLERETIQRRVADAYFSRSQRSLYMGGRVPYGYRLSPARIGEINTARYEPVPEEAAIVRRIYELYAEPECSYGDILRLFQADGITKNGKPWVRARLADIVHNPVYVRADLEIYRFFQTRGAVIVNSPDDFTGTNGCYYYTGRNSTGRKQTHLEGNCLVLAPHQGLVDSELWLRCWAKRRTPGTSRPYQKAKHTWLAGKLKCGLCGYALVSKHGRLLCSRQAETKICTGPGILYTEEMERLIYAELRKKLDDFPTLSPAGIPKWDRERAAREEDLAQAEEKLAVLTERLATSDELMYQYLRQQIEIFDSKKRAILQEIAHSRQVHDSRKPELRSYLTCWEALSFDEKRRVLDLLVQVIRITGDTIEIQWRI
ncbi:recombinase family protein [Intestinimonas massiliensis (ex Afouda et al. 2020)]|uniref:recombinase family protein n=1 Tax=Intestinimonas massiliensis (ex Afouda et al. 2020) TaxID=1673721 RepID=UPI001030EB65|nr:recombinase family protein [Intestinimonas massiliensis (ex Afouda et al. 2020)]